MMKFLTLNFLVLGIIFNLSYFCETAPRSKDFMFCEMCFIRQDPCAETCELGLGRMNDNSDVCYLCKTGQGPCPLSNICGFDDLGRMNDWKGSWSGIGFNPFLNRGGIIYN
ncbi:hypothetical protein PVAND_014634 [Polypedilum vanderplanki]|uniref:Uncharacterized protein n=1 Tax=Polypedilum vanderplanki TaxID=319348 RepID=A0A9J6BA94_POLVA|nr:hypothetical protein PVAND_014634 [Polypedilum vanderplanki]